LLPETVINVPTDPDLGVKSVMTGGVTAGEKVTFTAAEATLPARSVACTVIVFAPTLSVSEQVKEPFCTVAGALLQVTVEIPERASETLPFTETADVVNVAPLAGELILTVGGVLSRFTVTETVAVSPAVSVAVPVTT
jgi:hypothetical protein